MYTHASIWGAIDVVARNRNMSRSGLARFSGLDATAFNISKRFERSGKPHWPALYTLIKVLGATSMPMSDFGHICDDLLAQENSNLKD